MLTMFPSVSCFYNHFSHEPFNFTFIKYEKFIIVNMNEKSVVLTIRQLVSNVRLFQLYKLSLLLTKDVNNVETSKKEAYYASDGHCIYGYGTWSRLYWKQLYLREDYEFIAFINSPTTNPMERKAPLKKSNRNKIARFFRKFNNLYNDERLKEPNEIIREYFQSETSELFDYFQKYIKHEKKVEMLSVILHNYGHNVYSCVKKFI